LDNALAEATKDLSLSLLSSLASLADNGLSS
jgi:hypothetical protein